MENHKADSNTPEESNSGPKATDVEKPLSDTELENAVGGRKAGAIPYMEIKIKEVIVTGVQLNPNSLAGDPTNK